MSLSLSLSVDALLRDSPLSSGSILPAYAQGTYTLPAHISLLRFGRLPTNPGLNIPFANDKTTQYFLRAEAGFSGRKPLLETPAGATSVVDGMRKLGMQPLVVGGVGWFNSDTPLAKFWGYEFFGAENYV